jgi:lipocalin
MDVKNYLFFFGFFLNLLSGLAKPLTVTDLNISQYIGRWYQVYGAPTNTVFQGYGKCITADYSILPSGNVSVVNSQLNKQDELEQISGYGYYENINEPGQLTVHLDGVPVDSPYWVVKLGEVIDEQYQYSIITVPSGISNWILSRNLSEFYDKYNSEVTEYLNQNNYKYVKISQDNCEYNYEQVKKFQPFESNYKSECQVATYLKNAGFSQSSLPTMVCISKYESSFNCDASHKNTDGSTDYGLMQINSYYWCSGDPMSKYNGCSISCNSLYDCQANAKCAYTVWKQQGYNAWYGYKNHKAECDNYKLNC